MQFLRIQRKRNLILIVKFVILEYQDGHQMKSNETPLYYNLKILDFQKH